MSMTKEQRNKRIIKLANKVLYIRDKFRHEMKEYDKELYRFAKDSGETCAIGHIQREMEIGAKTTIDDELNNLYEYVHRALDDNYDSSVENILDNSKEKFVEWNGIPCVERPWGLSPVKMVK